MTEGAAVGRLLLMALLLALASIQDARADEPDAPPPSPAAATTNAARKVEATPAAPSADFESSRSIEDRIRESREQRRSFVDLGWRDAVHRLGDRVYDAVGLRFTLSYTVLYQRASAGTSPREAAGDDIDLIGTWDPFRSNPRLDGALHVAFQGRNRYADITPSALSQSIDSLWATTSGFNEQPFSLIQVYWRQALFGGRLDCRVGKLSPYSTFFGNRINSSALFFVSYVFADNPAVFMPGNGFGLHATWRFDATWSLAFGIQDANGVKTEIDPSTLGRGEFWTALQLQRKLDLPGLGKGTYRIGTWYVTPREQAGTEAGGGGVLSIDQELGPKAIAFLRYEYQGSNLLSHEVMYDALTGTEHVMRGGFVFPGPVPAWSDDLIGIAGAWGAPAESGLGDSVVGEIFYRGQITTASQLTFSLQMIRSSTLYDHVFVCSGRFRLEL